MKTYQKYSSLNIPLGLICSKDSNIIFYEKFKFGSSNKTFNTVAICGALENVYVWDLRKSEIVLVLKGDNYIVTQIACNNDSLAVGYSNGDIRLWNLKDPKDSVLLTGHTSAVSALNFSDNFSLASGSLDTSIIIWDVVNECGLYKLKSHTAPITACRFMRTQHVLITSSKDMSVKLWDLLTFHCFATLVGHNSEVWDFCLFSDESGIVVATSDDEFKLWKFEHSVPQLGKRAISTSNDLKDIPIKCHQIGQIIKKSHSRSKNLFFEPDTSLLFCLNKNSSIEIFKIIYPKKFTKKESSHPIEILPEYFSHIGIIPGQDISTFYPFRLKESIMLCLSFKNNYIEILNLSLNFDSLKPKKLYSISNGGHRSPPTCVALNYISSCIATGSSEQVKLWDPKQKKCVRTLSLGDCTALTFLQNDSLLLVGTKLGVMVLFNVLNGSKITQFEAHTNKIWEIRSFSSQLIISASSDQTVKFWKLKDNEIQFISSIKMDDVCLSIAQSHDQKFIAIGLIDSNVKIHFIDSLKHYLTLYGHKLPVNSLDVSTDNTLVITGSADKNIKIWGLNFGDCRKSIFAHLKGINTVRFVSQSHNFFSCSDDGVLKYWDGDNFQQLLELNGHHNEVKQFAISNDGFLIASISSDFSCRTWEMTDDLFVAENEFDETEGLITKAPIKEAEIEALAPGKPSVSSLIHAEDIAEAIDIVQQDQLRDKKEPCHPLLKNYSKSPLLYVIDVLKRTPPNELDVTLTTLPYKYVIKFLPILLLSLKNGFQVELCCRCLSFLSKLHYYQISNTHEMGKLVSELSTVSKERLSSLKSMVGVNIACLNHIKRRIENETNSSIYKGIKRLKF